MSVRPASTRTRLIVEFFPELCCSKGPGFDDEVRAKPPPELLERGVTQAQWDEAMRSLEADVQSKQVSGCAQVFIWITLILLPLLCFWQGQYNRAMRRWLDNLNTNVLLPRGMLAKFQTNRIDKLEFSWLAIALTDAEVELLRREPVMWRPECCGTGITPNECECCCCCCGTRRVV